MDRNAPGRPQSSREHGKFEEHRMCLLQKTKVEGIKFLRKLEV
jgi:hypothetical protein